MKRIICVGNRYSLVDAAGPKVYEELGRRTLPHDVEVIDGGLAGLDLLRFVEGTERVVFVDSVVGFGRSGEILVLKQDELATTGGMRYGHGAGLSYLLRVLPQICDGVSPEVLLVGMEGTPDDGLVDDAATISLRLAAGEVARTEQSGGGK